MSKAKDVVSVVPEEILMSVINRIKPSQEKAVKCHHFLMNINPFLIFDQNFSNGNFYR